MEYPGWEGRNSRVVHKLVSSAGVGAIKSKSSSFVDKIIPQERDDAQKSIRKTGKLKEAGNGECSFRQEKEGPDLVTPREG